jgi:glycosyltransferase involved in cell wall biosynthesis
MTIDRADDTARSLGTQLGGMMAGDSPLVSVIIPAYNSAAFLSDAVDSAVRQTYRSVELIIVNDGSTDDTSSLAERLAAHDARITVVHQPNAGLSAARNTGLKVARGEFVSFLDADDALLPEKIEHQVAFLREHPDCDLVYSDHYIANAKLEPIGLRAPGPPPLPFGELFVLRNWFPPVVPLITASLARRVGPFDESLHAAEDWDYWIRCAAAGRFGYRPGAVAVYRFHPNQMSRQSDRMRRSEFQLIDKHYGDSERRSRLARGARYLQYAKQSKRRPVTMLRELARFVTTVRDAREIALLMRVV